MPLIVSNISKIPPSCILHPLQANIQPHAQLITQVIHKLITTRFEYSLSTECIALTQHFIDEMNDLYLYEAEKIDDNLKPGCLAIMLSSFIIFYRLLKETNSVDQLIDTQKMHSGFDEATFDPACIESEGEDYDDDISDTQSSSSDTHELSSADLALSREKSIFGAMVCSSLIAYKLHYDTYETHVGDIFKLFARIYKSLMYEVLALFTQERQKKYPNWQKNAKYYEEILLHFKSKFIAFSQEEFSWFERFGKGLDDSFKKKYDQIVNKLKILTSFNFYNRQGKYCFSLFQIEENALPKLYGKLPLYLNFTQCYELIKHLQAFAQGTLSFEEFDQILCNAGKSPRTPISPADSSVAKLQYTFPLFSLSQSSTLTVSSAPDIPSPKPTRQRHFSF